MLIQGFHQSLCLSEIFLSHPQEGVKGPILHELGDDHDRDTVGDDTVEADDVGVLKLAHDAGLAEEFAALLLRVAPFQGLDGHVDLLLARYLQKATADLSEFTCESRMSSREERGPLN